MQRIAFTCILLLTATAFIVASPPTLAEEGEQASCAAQRTSLKDLSAAELTAWAEEGGMELLSPSAAAASSTPLCPERRSCEPCQQGDGPCFLKEFGSNSCCTSPTGPCFLCPEGTTIIVTTCPCVGSFADCPRRDQDWECG